MNKNIGVLFDLDGVLIDTESRYTEFWAEIASTYDTGIEDFAYHIKGNNLQRILTTYFPTEMHNDLIEYVHRLEENMVYEIFDGVIELLEELKAQDIPFAIVTSSGMEKMERLRKQQPEFVAYFDHIVTGDMVNNSKPHPECFLKGAELINRDIRDCYVFEDSPAGIEAGLSSGATVIALTTTIRPEHINHQVHQIHPSIKSAAKSFFR
ncbi:MAG: HAD family phosphatase [Bacteroidales bacterium]